MGTRSTTSRRHLTCLAGGPAKAITDRDGWAIGGPFGQDNADQSGPLVTGRQACERGQ